MSSLKPRRAATPQSIQTREKIAASIRAKAAARGVLIWDDARKQRLRTAFASGGLRAAYAAFPEMREPQIRAAVTRYCLRHYPAAEQPQRSGSCWNDPDFVRRFHEALTGMSY